MPLGDLMTRLKEITHDQVVRVDEEVSANMQQQLSSTALSTKLSSRWVDLAGCVGRHRKVNSCLYERIGRELT